MITAFPHFRAIAETIVPEAAQLSAEEWRSVNTIIEHAVAQRPARMQRQLALFVRALNVWSLVRYGRTLAQLDAARRTKFFEALEGARVLLIRRGFWGLRTLVLMGFYARPEAMPLIGYRAHVRGWQARLPV